MKTTECDDIEEYAKSIAISLINKGLDATRDWFREHEGEAIARFVYLEYREHAYSEYQERMKAADLGF